MKKSKTFATTFVILFAVALLGCYWVLQYTDALLSIGNIGYEPPADIVALETDFTSHAKTLYYSARPSLEDSAAFNEHCNSHNANISVLGCYANGQIYIYNIRSSELPGIRESTAAHEMLHVAWAHLSDLERMQIEPLLREIYDQHPELSADLNIYDVEDQIDELHSRVGTEVADLPDALESHYAKYFQNQDNIVALYESYAAPFRRLAAEIKELSEQIDAENAEITAASEQYYQDMNELSARFDGFNSCARTPGCFGSQSEYDRRKKVLLAAEAELSQRYEELNVRITDYNKLVDQYNKNLLKSKSLENSINSNAPPEFDASANKT